MFLRSSRAGVRHRRALGGGSRYDELMRGVEQIPWLYDAMMAFSDAIGLKWWRLWLVRGVRGRTLDLGAGTGRNLRDAVPRAREVIAIDPSHEALLAARKRAPNALLVRASAEALPFRAGSVDVVLSSLVFCSVPDPIKGLGEVKRVLAPGGELRMIEHVRSRRPLGARWQDFIQPLWTRVSGGCHPNRDTESNVERAGFVIDSGDRRESGTLRRFVARPTRLR